MIYPEETPECSLKGYGLLPECTEGTQRMSCPVPSERRSSHIRRVSSDASLQSVQGADAPTRPSSQKARNHVDDDDDCHSYFEWDSDDEDEYNHRLGRIRAFYKATHRRHDHLESEDTASRSSSADRYESARSSTQPQDSGLSSSYNDLGLKTHLSRFSSLSSSLKRSASAASRLTRRGKEPTNRGRGATFSAGSEETARAKR